jgi:hypothetical protein
MAFDFLGTIRSIEEFEELVEFINIEVENIDKRIEHMEQEKNRLNELLDKYKSADLELRAIYPSSKQADENYLKKPRPVDIFKVRSIDAVNAIDVEDLKKMFIDTIKYRREKNEFKIKKIRYVVERMDKEISFLNNMKENYQDYISRINSRFDSDDFPELQRVPDVDSADVTPGIKAYTPNQGTETLNGDKLYLVLSISSARRTISFDTQAPPVKAGDKITLLNGLNNGEKTVARIVDRLTVEVLDSLKDESDSQSKAKINK